MPKSQAKLTYSEMARADADWLARHRHKTFRYRIMSMNEAIRVLGEGPAPVGPVDPDHGPAGSRDCIVVCGYYEIDVPQRPRMKALGYFLVLEPSATDLCDARNQDLMFGLHQLLDMVEDNVPGAENFLHRLVWPTTQQCDKADLIIQLTRSAARGSRPSIKPL